MNESITKNNNNINKSNKLKVLFIVDICALVVLIVFAIIGIAYSQSSEAREYLADIRALVSNEYYGDALEDITYFNEVYREEYKSVAKEVDKIYEEIEPSIYKLALNDEVYCNKYLKYYPDGKYVPEVTSRSYELRLEHYSQYIEDCKAGWAVAELEVMLNDSKIPNDIKNEAKKLLNEAKQTRSYKLLGKWKIADDAIVEFDSEYAHIYILGQKFESTPYTLNNDGYFKLKLGLINLTVSGYIMTIDDSFMTVRNNDGTYDYFYRVS